MRAGGRRLVAAGVVTVVTMLLSFGTGPGALGQTGPRITSLPPVEGIVGLSYAHQFATNLPAPAAT